MQFRNVIEKSLEVMSGGGVILYPTDTIWGIGGDASNESTVQKVYTIKNRAESKSLVSLVSDIEMLQSLTFVSASVIELLKNSERPTTIIYSAISGIHPSARSENGSAAVRVVKNEFCKALISALKRPLLSTSANLSGQPSPTDFQSVSLNIKESVDYIVPLYQNERIDSRPSRILKVNGDEVIVIRE